MSKKTITKNPQKDFCIKRVVLTRCETHRSDRHPENILPFKAISTMNVFGNNSCESSIMLVNEHLRSLMELRTWIASWQDLLNCRPDEDFLLMFLHSCEYDVEFTKKTLKLYYENRVRKPEWWTKRDLTCPEMKRIIKLKIMCTLIEVDSAHPIISIFKISRVGSDHRVFDNVLKLVGIFSDFISYRLNARHNGHICIVDLGGYPWWVALKGLNPSVCKDYISSFVYSIPVCLKRIVFVNAPSILNTVIRLIQPMLSHHQKHKIHTFGSDLSQLGEIVPLEALPVELGGFNGLLEQHEEAFEKNLMEFNNFLVDDEKYGFFSKNALI